MPTCIGVVLNQVDMTKPSITHGIPGTEQKYKNLIKKYVAEAIVCSWKDDVGHQLEVETWVEHKHANLTNACNQGVPINGVSNMDRRTSRHIRQRYRHQQVAGEGAR